MNSETALASEPRAGRRAGGREPKLRPRHKASPFATLAARGEPMVWLTGGALALSMVMVVGLLVLVFVQGIGTFWPIPVEKLTTADGQVYLGELTRSETYRPEDHAFRDLPKPVADEARKKVAESGGVATRRLYRIGNFELTQTPFRWVDDFLVLRVEQPKWAMVVERFQNMRFYGELKALKIDGQIVAATPEEAWQKFNEIQPEVDRRRNQAIAIDKGERGALDRTVNSARLAKTQAELDYGDDSPKARQAAADLQRVERMASEQRRKIQAEIDKLNKENARYALVIKPVQSGPVDIRLDNIVRAYPANQLSFGNKLGVYLSRWGEFLTDDPRDSNTAGGYFPAIWGTIAMTLIMTIIVVPFGVLAALYLREYAKSGPITSAVRIAINNLAGVPSVVFGAFGLGFFCYGLGGYIDTGPESPWPTGVWFALLAADALVGVIAFFIGLSGGSNPRAIPSQRSLQLRRLAMALWFVSLGLAALLVAKMPFFHGFYRANAINGSSVFNGGGLLWASLTLALLTAPVVIVATEEALAAVPYSMREGSYACGASKWQTIRRIVLPRALPGILTGMILAMARGAGEVAPLMLVGVKKYTPALPMDSSFPYVHPSRSFMHLAYMIYDVGFNSPDSEAARSMLFTATLLLITIVALANLAAIWLRKRLRRKFVSAQF
ncbi:MAG TPA: ABC transporter permease subunit [Pirellulales bacterium]|jgi:ABC-type phosphate transport system permease subunit